MIDELKKMKYMLNHKTSPIGRLDMKIISIDNEEINLVIKHDSFIKNEYWMFYNYNNSLIGTEIARVRTNIFDSYFPDFVPEAYGSKAYLKLKK